MRAFGTPFPEESAIETDAVEKQELKSKGVFLHPPALRSPSRSRWPGLATRIVGATVYL